MGIEYIQWVMIAAGNVRTDEEAKAIVDPIGQSGCLF